MLSVRKLNANRSNAQNSTGPRTAAGLARSSMNALTHGLTSVRIVIPGLEDPGEYDRLLRALVDDWDPRTAMETFCVGRLGQQIWRLMRAARFEKDFLAYCTDEIVVTPLDLDAYYKEEGHRRATLDALGMLFSSEDQLLKKQTIEIILNACITAVGANLRGVFLGGEAETMKAFGAFASKHRYTVGLVKRFLNGAQERLAACGSLPSHLSLEPNLIATVCRCLDTGRLFRDTSEQAKRRHEGLRTDAFLIRFERMAPIDRYETKVRRDISRTMQELRELQAERRSSGCEIDKYRTLLPIRRLPGRAASPPRLPAGS